MRCTDRPLEIVQTGRRLGFDPTGRSAVRSANFENLALEPNTKWIGRQVPRTLPVHLFRHFCCRMYRLATVHNVTDRWTDYVVMPIADHTAVQYDRLKNKYKDLICTSCGVLFGYRME